MAAKKEPVRRTAEPRPQERPADNRPSVSRTSAKPHKSGRKRSTAFWDFLKIACFSVFLIYTLNVIISNQDHIAEQKAEIARLTEEKTIAQQISDEYNRLLNAKTEQEYMREAAFEHGYAFPWEKRFFPVNNPE